MDTSNHGRINEAYNGSLGAAAQTYAKNRIDWVCSKAKGDKILDIGCSQGITSILLGKTGHHVVGIDIEENSIAYAQNDLSLESTDVRKRVSFKCADFMSLDFVDENFDTIVLCEILEHVKDPVEFLNKSIALMAPNGILIASVPFGINPHPDHKRTFYFIDFYMLLSRNGLIVTDIKHITSPYGGGWLCFSACSRNTWNVPVSFDINLLQKLDVACSSLDKARFDNITALVKTTQQQEQMIQDLTLQLNEITSQYHSLAQSKLGSLQLKYWVFRAKCIGFVRR